MNANRKKAEELIFKTLDAADKSGMNSAYYKGMFAKMSDSQFLAFCKKPLCIRYHVKPWVVQPSMSDIIEGLDILKVPLMEKVALPYLHTNEKGEPIWTNYEALVIYIHFKKMKQFAVKKTNVTHAIDARDMKTGLLTAQDKGGRTSDREMEGMKAMNMDDTMDELSTWRGDYMDAKSIAYATIAAKGTISKADIPIRNDDSLAKNMMNYYMLGSCLYTNVIMKDYYLPSTLKEKQQRKADRES